MNRGRMIKYNKRILYTLLLLFIGISIVYTFNRFNNGLKSRRITTEGFTENELDVSIYIVCYNEEIILPHTIKHYKDRFPSAKIYICDNYSTDNSAEIAEDMGCSIIKWKTTLDNFEFKLTELKNNIWKQSTGWVIICDMDEWLCVDANKLSEEEKKGTTLLQIVGYDMVGHSKSSTLNDIDLHMISYGTPNVFENKSLCFNTKYITEINFDDGAHKSNPKGNMIFSETPYYLKHMDWLGLEYKQNKMKVRYERTIEMRKFERATHYTNDMNKVASDYSVFVSKATDISKILG